MEMIPLSTPVVMDRVHRGVVVARTRQQYPLYDVRLDDGETVKYVSPDRLEEIKDGRFVDNG